MAQALADLRGWRTSAKARAVLGAWGEGGNLLLDDFELLHQHSSKLLDNVWSVPGILELHNDCLDNLIMDAFHVNRFGLGVGVGILGLDGPPLGAW